MEEGRTMKDVMVEEQTRLAHTHSGPMKSLVQSLQVVTSSAPQFVDITDRVSAVVREAEVLAGLAVVYSRHTTAAIKINEWEPLLLEDMARLLERVAPKDGAYQHNDFSLRTVNMSEDECPNGHAHCRHLLLSASETIPIIEGKIALGRWQRVFLVELDQPRTRDVLVQVLGV